MNVPLLYNICVSHIAVRLREKRWDPYTDQNPFSLLPAEMVENLVEAVTAKDPTLPGSNQPIEFSSLRLLLASGRIKNFKFENVKLSLLDETNVYRTLETVAENLKSIKINSVLLGTDIDPKSRGLGKLLAKSKNLESLESDVKFEFLHLRPCVRLKKVILNFLVDDNFQKFVAKYLEPDESSLIWRYGQWIGTGGILDLFCAYDFILRVLRFRGCEGATDDIRHWISVVLHWCPSLAEITYDVTVSLGVIMLPCPNLQICHLGRGSPCYPVNEAQVSGASSLFPNLRDVLVVPQNYEAIRALSQFQHITSLTLIKAFPYNPEGITPLLSDNNFGSKLERLRIHRFSEVDLTSIGSSCPNLEHLLVDDLSENNLSRVSDTAFRKLTSLIFGSTISPSPHTASSLICLLSYATNLEFLSVHHGSRFGDAALYTILETNQFNRLVTLNISQWSISFEAWETFVPNLLDLKDVNVSSGRISEEDARRALQNNNIRPPRFTWTDD